MVHISNKKKYLSLFLVFVIILQIFTIIPVGATGNVKASNKGVINFSNSNIPYETSLEDNGDGTYSWNFDVESISGLDDTSADSTQMQDGWFTALVEGYYLVELWGGNGGAGEDTSYSNGGVGGNGGYVYSKVYLAEGETLFYAIGGNGGTVTHSVQGGAGGGGTHGESGWYEVGAGGGYSAVYKYGVNEFENAYLDANNEMTSADISESDRITRCLMIAGGGGGGGTGNGFGIGVKLSATGSKGGQGGNILTSQSGVISGVGTYYVGENGYSSGSSTAYIGKGGTSIPGEKVCTRGEQYYSEDGQDWISGGEGGDGNVRGGAGGAGYCGGSGGVNQAFLEPYNVGGGGGASSFVSANVSTALSADERTSLTSGGVNPNSTNGGSVHIAFLGTDAENEIDYLSDINFTGTLSEYFEIVSTNISGTTGSLSHTTSSFTLNDVLLHDGVRSYPLHLSVVFKPKDTFPGGNDVPVFVNDEISCIADGGEGTKTITVEGSEGYLNVPLSLTATGNTCVYDMTVSSPVPVNGSSLYTEDALYTNTKNNAGSGLYKFITSVSNYKVNGSAPSATYTPNKSTQYTVSYDVVPVASRGIATVGEVVANKTVSAKASITVLKNTTVLLNGNNVDYKKTLTYENGTYYFNVDVESSVQHPYQDTVEYANNSASSYTSNSTYTAPFTGYYLVQAWGGKGGNGGSAKPSGVGNSYSGGSGANGGYAYSVIKLNAGETFSVVVGANGTDGADTSGTKKHAAGGTGGTYSAVVLSGNNVAIVAAGGGGGGGGEKKSSYSGANGDSASANSSVSSVSSITLSTAYNGGNGGTGSGDTYTAQPAGASPNSARNSSLNKEGYTGCTSSASSLVSAASSAGAQSSASVTVTPLDRTGSSLVVNSYDLLTIDFSQYFNVGTPIVSVGSGSYGTVSNSSNTLTIANIAPAGCGTYSDGTLQKDIAFSVRVPLTPINGFLGGNDVPVLDSAVTLYQADSNSNASDNTVTFAAQNDTDYANVEIPDIFTLSSNNAVYVSGGSAVALSDVVSYTVQNATAPQKAFVNYTTTPVCTPSFNGSPSSDISYTFSLTIEPKTSATKAVVIPEAEAITDKRTATITVKNSVTCSLSNITASGYTAPYAVIENGNGFSTVLTPATDYTLPDSITVTCDGNPINYTYDAFTGELEIPASEITGAVTVTASAVKPVKQYTIHYVYQLNPNDTVTTGEHTEQYLAEDTIIDWTSSYTPTSYPGYSFVWDEVPDEMPAQDVWIIGGYVANTYAVTIHYYINGTTTSVSADYTDTYYYGEEYSVLSPTVEGYTTATTVVTGTVSGNETVNVYYTVIPPGTLTITYLFADTLEEVTSGYTNTYGSGVGYSVSSPSVNGYTPDTAVVSGTMTSSGYSCVVLYYPNQVTVSFNTNGGSACSDVSVVYNNIYGYNGTDYVALPTPIKNGSKFLGWYSDAGFTNLVDEETKVTSYNAHTLYAKWKELQFDVVIRYIYEDGETAATEKTLTGALNSAYSQTSPSITGCTADTPVVSGNFLGVNQVVYVTYIGNQYTLTVYYKDASTGNAMSGMSTHTESVKYRDSYSVTSPAVPSGYVGCSQSVVSGKMPAEAKSVTVYYSVVEEIVSVSVDWGSLEYNYSYNEWDSASHQYGDVSFVPAETGADVISVTSNSNTNVYVNADISCSLKSAYSGVNAVIKDGSNTVTEINNILPGTTKNLTLELSGMMPYGSDGRTLNIGSVTVTVKGGQLVL